ncbi:L-arabinose isomerase [Erwinia amylovora]|uniref:L-arabinose isomerase n=1 Tax=Erwinia amylovora TaxID=552 RepID=UPI001D082943|nr:L-arabinose isomerase [Erwinia amylovora]UDJ88272.1 L-arabinose isomerase [Erwinia amylovora]UDJ99731.1 L-arabinose isomerase [Erwinia amylovora]UDK88211.1 L-arabinose isomerase [Erwinia amylovora]UDK91607.1 L-arabinose isomerase [Erwinia amylovora]UOD75619.1 L-arabinose isomerase [Erwinia amylovora]
MTQRDERSVWLVIGTQHLYGAETLRQVELHGQQVVDGLNHSDTLPYRLQLRPLVKSADEALALCREANHHDDCLGVISWLHTFSPAKMWIGGLTILHKPLLQFHTQFNAEIPWDSMDMDFMNLNQTAHGGREFGFIGARMRLSHQVVTGHWQDKHALLRIARWMRTAAALQASRQLKVARFGDNMRDVAVTEGDKVAAQIQFGYSVNGWGVGDLVEVINQVSDGDVNTLVDEYQSCYRFSAAAAVKRQNVQDAARIELGIKRFLDDEGCKAFTTNFQTLHGMTQLPGLAVQRLMQQGYGFAGEGDWKTAALLHICKVMAGDRPGGTSFMEDYTYHFAPGSDMVLGSHMLEVCPSIAGEAWPLLDVQPLGIGGKADPARLIFAAAPGRAVNACLIDMGDRFRLLVNVVDAIEPPQPLPKLPVARALWRAQPSLATASEAWILGGGAHHTVFSQALTVDDLRLYGEMQGIEVVVIDEQTTLHGLRDALRWNEAYYRLNQR